MADGYYKCPRCSYGTTKIGEALDGKTATFKCQKSTCGHVFFNLNIRKVYSFAGGGGSRKARDFSRSQEQIARLQQQLEREVGVDRAREMMLHRREELTKWLAKQGIRDFPSLRAAVREHQTDLNKLRAGKRIQEG